MGKRTHPPVQRLNKTCSPRDWHDGFEMPQWKLIEARAHEDEALTEAGIVSHVGLPVVNPEGYTLHQAPLHAKPKTVMVLQDMSRPLAFPAHLQAVAARHFCATHHHQTIIQPRAKSQTKTKSSKTKPRLGGPMQTHNMPKKSTDECAKNLQQRTLPLGREIGSRSKRLGATYSQGFEPSDRNTCTRLSSCFGHGQPPPWIVTHATSESWLIGRPHAKQVHGHDHQQYLRFGSKRPFKEPERCPRR